MIHAISIRKTAAVAPSRIRLGALCLLSACPHREHRVSVNMLKSCTCSGQEGYQSRNQGKNPNPVCAPLRWLRQSLSILLQSRGIKVIVVGVQCLVTDTRMAGAFFPVCAPPVKRLPGTAPIAHMKQNASRMKQPMSMMTMAVLLTCPKTKGICHGQENCS